VISITKSDNKQKVNKSTAMETRLQHQYAFICTSNLMTVKHKAVYTILTSERSSPQMEHFLHERHCQRTASRRENKAALRPRHSEWPDNNNNHNNGNYTLHSDN